MTFTNSIEKNTLFLQVDGDLIGSSDDASLLDFVYTNVEENVLYCVVDIAKVNYMNSSGLTVLIRLLTRFRNRGGEMMLIQPSETVSKLLVITKLNAIFQIFANRADAQTYISKNFEA